MDNHAFRLILNQFGLKPLRRLDDLAKTPEQTILIVFGETEAVRQIPNGLRSFVEAGGAVLIATDRQTPSFFRRTDMQLGVTGLGVSAQRGIRCYGDQRHCPFAHRGSGPDAAMFETSHSIATNRPSYVAISANDLKGTTLSVFAWLRNSALERAIGTQYVREPLPFAVGGTMGKGRILVVADHSIFINGMMLPSDLQNGNMQFAYNCVRWLKNRTRTRALFIDEGHIETSFDVPLATDGALPDLPVSPIQLANAVITAAEREDLFNRYILEALGERRVLRMWLIGLTAALLIYGVFRLMRAGYQAESKVPLVTRSIAQLQPAASVVDRRHQQSVSDGNFYEAARELAVAALTEVGYDPALARTWEKPTVRVDGNWWNRQTLSHRVHQLWKLAYDDQTRPVSRRQLAALLVHVDEVRRAARRGILTIDV